ncbi:MAG: DUF1643 domain-containing protein [Gammaproteobacteria bacterium]|nr:DUF1643 domain-containing protein [Gammaproteobacteria bacterium]
MDSRQILESTAAFDATLTHRLCLTRRWGQGPLMLAVGLNPSRAGATENDPTVRRVMRLLDAQGFAALVMLNLWSLISVTPQAVVKTEGRWTEADWARFHGWFAQSKARLWMWGALGRGHPDLDAICASDSNAFCFGITRAGMPKHPLYLPASTPLVRYRDQRRPH